MSKFTQIFCYFIVRKGRLFQIFCMGYEECWTSQVFFVPIMIGIRPVIVTVMTCWCAALGACSHPTDWFTPHDRQISTLAQVVLNVSSPTQHHKSIASPSVRMTTISACHTQLNVRPVYHLLPLGDLTIYLSRQSLSSIYDMSCQAEFSGSALTFILKPI